MSNIFIINAGVKVHGTGGELNSSLTEMAKRILVEHGHSVIVTDLNENWQLQTEIQHIKESDVILLQTPIWAMGVPWPMKRYIDIVLTNPEVCGTDGRSRSNPDKKYGSGGFLTKKRYMLSTTWNAPLEALTEPGLFFDGRGLDEVLLPLHKQFQYMGLRAMPSFSIHDVYKNPSIEKDLKRWEQHLKQFFLR